MTIIHETLLQSYRKKEKLDYKVLCIYLKKMC